MLTENALAERVNRTIKSEFGLYTSRKGLKETTAKIRDSVTAYNEIRPHSGIDLLTPKKAHNCSGKLKRHWKGNTERAKNKVCIAEEAITELMYSTISIIKTTCIIISVIIYKSVKL
ncbi:integrase core domain-containing protein [Sphingobacterium sp. JUb20]|uniref:integrase core domain-containing protein n=1 Tax=unclassified Sphingobacterium TaxID=2609468 RepID=UPI001049588A